jgi:hypothetical protein
MTHTKMMVMAVAAAAAAEGEVVVSVVLLQVVQVAVREAVMVSMLPVAMGNLLLTPVLAEGGGWLALVKRSEASEVPGTTILVHVVVAPVYFCRTFRCPNDLTWRDRAASTAAARSSCNASRGRARGCITRTISLRNPPVGGARPGGVAPAVWNQLLLGYTLIDT